MQWLGCYVCLVATRRGELRAGAGALAWPGEARVVQGQGGCCALCVSVSQRQDTEYHQPCLTIILPVKVITIPPIIFIGVVKIYMSYSDVLLRL